MFKLNSIKHEHSCKILYLYTCSYTNEFQIKCFFLCVDSVFYLYPYLLVCVGLLVLLHVRTSYKYIGGQTELDKFIMCGPIGGIGGGSRHLPNDPMLNIWLTFENN